MPAAASANCSPREECLDRLADDGAGLDAGVGADSVELEGHEHMELIAAVSAVALHGVVDGDNFGSYRLIADVDYQSVALLDPSRSGPADHKKIAG